jgi:adenine phosphoribosyltransferase
MEIASKIRSVKDWPKKGINFRDITTLIKNKEGLQDTMHQLKERYKDMEIDYVAGIESRGFITGATLAHGLNVGFIPIRKAGKLPADVISEEYDLEYGTDKIEIHTDAFNKGDKILIVDDLIATGGTAIAACKLIEKLGGEVVECSFIINLVDLGGSKKLEEKGHKVHSLVSFEGE